MGARSLPKTGKTTLRDHASGRNRRLDSRKTLSRLTPERHAKLHGESSGADRRLTQGIAFRYRAASQRKIGWKWPKSIRETGLRAKRAAFSGKCGASGGFRTLRASPPRIPRDALGEVIEAGQPLVLLGIVPAIRHVPRRRLGLCQWGDHGVEAIQPLPGAIPKRKAGHQAIIDGGGPEGWGDGKGCTNECRERDGLSHVVTSSG